MKKTTYGNNSAFTVHNFLSPQECEKWKQRATAIGFQKNTPISTNNGPVVNTKIRNNDRALVDNPVWANELWRRMQSHFPSSGHTTAIGLNERFRFYRYYPGQYFKPHLDGSFVRNKDERSLWTILIYLNSDMLGGGTKLFWHDVTIQPETGLLLAFLHRQPHAGNELLDGVKYVLRSDVMFRVSNPCG